METTLNKYQPQVLSIMRIMFGLLYLSHGLVKWFGFPVAGPPNVTLFSMLGAAGIIEIVCGTLVALGLFTRYAAIIISGQMAVAYFFYANRLSRGFMPIQNGGILDVAYCFAFLYLGFAGGGPWSLDAMWRKRP
jgi:putative oxidoreductase